MKAHVLCTPCSIWLAWCIRSCFIILCLAWSPASAEERPPNGDGAQYTDHPHEILLEDEVSLLQTFATNDAHGTRFSSGLRAPPGPLPLEFAGFSHFKHWTQFLGELMFLLAVNVQIPFKSENWNRIRDDPTVGCNRHAATLYEDVRPRTLERILAECPHMKMVHMVRRPSSSVVSSYVWAKHFNSSQEWYDTNALLFDVKGAILRSMSLEAGMNLMCADYYRDNFPQFWGTSAYIKEHHVTNVLQIRTEDFATNYDQTTRSLYAHFLGSRHPLIETLVLEARALDKNRFSAGELAHMPHISDPQEKTVAREMLVLATKQHNQCMQQLLRDDRLLGYDDREA